jgi:ankyrin repeat protein
LDVVKFFVERNKSDVDAEDAQGETPIVKAAENGRLDVVRYLIENGIFFLS